MLSKLHFMTLTSTPPTAQVDTGELRVFCGWWLTRGQCHLGSRRTKRCKLSSYTFYLAASCSDKSFELGEEVVLCTRYTVKKEFSFELEFHTFLSLKEMITSTYKNNNQNFQLCPSSVFKTRAHGNRKFHERNRGVVWGNGGISVLDRQEEKAGWQVKTSAS